MAYRLSLPSGCALHPVCHVSLLKEYRGPLPPEAPPPPDLPPTLLPKPAAILNRRTVSGPDGPRVEVLVDWEGVPWEETAWEDLAELVKVFLEIDFEDKVIVEGGVIDANPNPQPMEPGPTISEESPVTAESTLT